MNPTPNDNLDAQSEEKFSGELKGPSALPLAIACLSTGLFLGSFFTKKAPISLVISSA